jgi:hypothetical protein
MLLKAVPHLKAVPPVPTRLRARSLATMAASQPTISIEVVSDVVW